MNNVMDKLIIKYGGHIDTDNMGSHDLSSDIKDVSASIERIMESLLKSDVPLSKDKLQDIADYYTLAGWDKVFTQKVSNKENLAWLSAKAMQCDLNNINLVALHAKSATDVLRIAAAYSDSDVSLTNKPRFIKFSRPQKRAFLFLLDRCKKLEEDIQRRPEEFKRFAERLSARDYPSFKQVNRAFNALSRGKKFAGIRKEIEIEYIVITDVREENKRKEIDSKDNHLLNTIEGR